MWCTLAGGQGGRGVDDKDRVDDKDAKTEIQSFMLADEGVTSYINPRKVLTRNTEPA